MQRYDMGLLNNFGGGNVEWWQDYLRCEICRCNEWWKDQVSVIKEEKDKQIATLKDELEIAKGEAACAYTVVGHIQKSCADLRADNQRQAEEIAALKHDLEFHRNERERYEAYIDKMGADNSVLREQNSAMNKSLVKLRPENERYQEALKWIKEVAHNYATAELRMAVLVLQALVDWSHFNKEELHFTVEIDGSVTWRKKGEEVIK